MENVNLLENSVTLLFLGGTAIAIASFTVSILLILSCMMFLEFLLRLYMSVLYHYHMVNYDLNSIVRLAVRLTKPSNYGEVVITTLHFYDEDQLLLLHGCKIILGNFEYLNEKHRRNNEPEVFVGRATYLGIPMRRKVFEEYRRTYSGKVIHL